MTAFWIYFTVLSLIHLYFCYFKLEKLRMLTKPLLLLSLAVFYAFVATPVRVPVLLALICGLAGDIFLIWHRNDRLFIIGAGAFTIGHVFYSIILYGSAAHSGLPLSLWGIAAIFGIYALLVGGASISIGKHIDNALFKPLMPVYLGIVAVVNVGAWINLFSAARYGGNVFGAAVALVGAMLFLVSDTILARALFARDVKHDNFYVMLTYIAAQGCLCFGLL